jgi:hypothetical protein
VSNKTLIAQLLCGLIALIVAACTCQAASTADAAWLSLGIGGGARTDDADNHLLDAESISIGASVRRASNVVSLRHARLDATTTTNDFALLLERVLVSRKVNVTAGAGVAWLRQDRERAYGPFAVKRSSAVDATVDNVGVAWHIQIATNSGANLRGGLQWFGSLAGEASFWGMGIVLDVGRLWTGHRDP